MNKVEDLDLLLNYQYWIRVDTKQAILINDFFPQITNIPNLLTESIPTLNGIYVSWNEEADRAALVSEDDTYTKLYDVIGKVANPVLLNVDAAIGDQAMANRLKAEALVLRGWFHYLLVNIYAKAYNPETAETDPGIVYALETDFVEVPNKKLTVQQVYDQILADINKALDLGSLPVSPNRMRIGLPFAYAAKAKILMSMRDYEGAFAAAGESLKLNNTINDYNDLLKPENILGTGTIELTRPYLTLEEDLFDTPSNIVAQGLTPDLWNTFEDNHLFTNYLLTDERVYGSLIYGISSYGIVIPYSYGFNIWYNPLGLTTVDMYLVQSECYIRNGNITEAMKLLNQIRENRVNPYKPASASSENEAMDWLKRISRTENFATFKNFINLKRWNTEVKYQETLRKTIEWDINILDNNGQIVDVEHHTFTAELRPDSPLWIFPFPQNARNYNPNLTQNYLITD